MLFASVVLSAIIGFVNCDDLYHQILDIHNRYRDMHGVPHLTLNTTLNSFAQEWANHLANVNDFYHRPDNMYGENLYSTTGSLDPESAMAAFYNEIRLYDYNNPQFSATTGHFTQLVWKNSKQIGVGLSKGVKWTYLVINYNPPGNVIGQFEENVPPQIRTETTTTICDIDN